MAEVPEFDELDDGDWTGAGLDCWKTLYCAGRLIASVPARNLHPLYTRRKIRSGVPHGMEVFTVSPR